MNKIFGLIKDIIIGVWIVIAITVTVCLIQYDKKYAIPIFGKTSIISIEDDAYEPDLVAGDMLFIKKVANKKIDSGDKVFVIKKSSTGYYISIGTVESREDLSEVSSYFKINGESFNSDYILGAVKNTKIIHNLGYLYNIFRSKWGYMFLIILPTVFAIIYEIMLIIDEAKNLKDE